MVILAAPVENLIKLTRGRPTPLTKKKSLNGCQVKFPQGVCTAHPSQGACAKQAEKPNAEAPTLLQCMLVLLPVPQRRQLLLQVHVKLVEDLLRLVELLFRLKDDRHHPGLEASLWSRAPSAGLFIKVS